MAGKQRILEVAELELLPKRRHDALKGGSTIFFTGRPCSKGHITWRTAAGGACAECGRISARAFSLRRSITPAQRIASRRARMSAAQREEVKANRRSRWHRLVQEDPIGRWAIFAHDGARSRAKKKGIPFSLTKDYVRSLCVDTCPALGLKLIYCNPGKIAAESAQLDRIIPVLGYVPGNVQVISKRANVVKSDANVHEIGLIYEWMLKLT